MDLVLVKGIKPVVYTEIKTTNEPDLTKGFHESFKDLKCKSGFVVTQYRQTSYSLSEKFAIVGLHDFLINSLPLILKLR